MSKVSSQYSGTQKDIMFRFALRLLENREDALDVVQDVFEKLWKKRKSIEQHGSIEALSLKITRELCLDKLRQRSMKIEKLKTIRYSKNNLYQGPDYEVMDLANIIKALIRGLPEKQKMAIHLRDVEQFEFAEISDILGIDIQSVRMNLSRARKSIKKQLEKIMNHGL